MLELIAVTFAPFSTLDVFNAKLPTVFFWIFQNIMVSFHNI